MLIEPEQLLSAYCNGYFPMADSSDGEIRWYSPNPRTIFDLNNFHIPSSLKKKLKSKPFEYRINNDFYSVIKHCADRKETWISQDIIDSYVNLNALGYAFSFESYKNGILAGGLYGVAIKGAFFGESMFHIETDASKAALVFLIETLKSKNFKLLDTQYTTEHLKKFGAIEISKKEYLSRLQYALGFNCSIL